MSHPSSRPFESLDWYRDAARNGFRSDRNQGGVGAWFQGPAFLRAHLAMYAVGIVALFVVNLIRSPEDVWAIQWILAWTMLVLIHAVALGLVWAIRQWSADEPDEPLLVPSRAGGFAWGGAPPDASTVQDVNFRLTAAESDQSPESAWQGWSEDADEAEPSPTERASWSEASAGAWLNRSSRRETTPESSSEDPPNA